MRIEIASFLEIPIPSGVAFQVTDGRFGSLDSIMKGWRTLWLFSVVTLRFKKLRLDTEAAIAVGSGSNDRVAIAVGTRSVSFSALLTTHSFLLSAVLRRGSMIAFRGKSPGADASRLASFSYCCY